MRKLTTEDLQKRKPPCDAYHRQPRHPLFVLLNNIRSLQNVGMAFRLCDAIRASRLYLCGITGYPPLAKDDPRLPWVAARAGRTIAKTAIRTVDYVPWERRDRATDVIQELRQQHVQIVALEQTTASVAYTVPEYSFPLCIVLGHERDGVEEDVLELADVVIDVPMYGLGNSLNVITAAAIVLYHVLDRCPTRLPAL